MSCEWCGAFEQNHDEYKCEKCIGKKAVMDYIEIGAVPYGEPCAQVGSEGFRAKAKAESEIFARQLKRIWPDGDFRVKWFDHDFGSYPEVVAYYNSNDETDHLCNIAYEAESQGPEFWDVIAKEELKYV